MKVLLAGPYPIPPRASKGGIETAVSLLAHGLSGIPGVEVHVATVAFDEHGHYGLWDGQVRLHVLHSRQSTSQLRRYRLPRQWLGRVADSIEPDLVHVHGTNFYGAACTKMPYPCVLTVHGLHGREARLDFTDSSLAWRLYRRTKGVFNERFERETLSRSDDIISISPYINTELVNGKCRLHRISNPVADRFYSLPDKAEPGRVLFVGAIHARKGLIPLLRALALVRDKVADVRLVIVGAVHSSDYHHAVECEMKRLRLGDAVEWRGHVSDDELDEEYARAAVVVLPSQEETAPFALQQAMAAATPVVATRVGGIPHIVENDQTGILVPYGDVPALAHALRRLLGDEGMRVRFGAEARRLARERFQLSTIVQQTVHVYQSVITGVASDEAPTRAA
jgi:glycosyltransferase involved in cell wall biosynthesis